MSWPEYAHILAGDVEISSAETVQRTPLEDGRVRQRLVAPGAPRRRTIRAYVESDARREEFEIWAAIRSHVPFPRPLGIEGGIGGGTPGQVVVVGGAGGVRYRAVIAGDGTRQWDIELELEDAG